MALVGPSCVSPKGVFWCHEVFGVGVPRPGFPEVAGSPIRPADFVQKGELVVLVKIFLTSDELFCELFVAAFGLQFYLLLVERTAKLRPMRVFEAQLHEHFCGVEHLDISPLDCFFLETFPTSGRTGTFSIRFFWKTAATGLVAVLPFVGWAPRAQAAESGAPRGAAGGLCPGDPVGAVQPLRGGADLQCPGPALLAVPRLRFVASFFLIQVEVKSQKIRMQRELKITFEI